MSVRPVLLTLAAAAAPVAHAPNTYVEQGRRNDGRVEVLMLDEGGRVISLVARRPRAGGLDLGKGYWFSCGRWQAQGNRLTISARLQESYRFAAPPDAGTTQGRVLAITGDLLGTGALRMELRDGARRFALVKNTPVDAATITRLRFTCDEHDRNAVKR